MVVDVVHRFWLGPLSAIPSLLLTALLTFSSHSQILGTYDVAIAGTLLLAVPNLEVRDAGEHLSLEDVRSLRYRGIKKQIIKDLFTFLVLYAEGGLFADLDYL